MKLIVLLLLCSFVTSAVAPAYAQQRIRRLMEIEPGSESELRILKLIDEKQALIEHRLSAIRSVQFHIGEIEADIESSKGRQTVGTAILAGAFLPTLYVLYGEFKNVNYGVKKSSKVAAAIAGLVAITGVLIAAPAIEKIKKLKEEIKKNNEVLDEYAVELRQDQHELEDLRASITCER